MSKLFNPFLEIIEHTILITTFVMVMMIVIEYLTVLSKGRWSLPIKNSGWKQILLAAFLGILPGCMGTFAAVSLYAHKIIGFAALVTVMIATSGDEAFIMFSMIPRTAIILTLVIFAIAIISGFVLQLFFKEKTLMVTNTDHMKFNHMEPCLCFDRKNFINDFFSYNPQRFLFMAGGILFLSFQLSDVIGSDEWLFEQILYFVAGIIGLAIILTVPKHFLNEHIWKHVVKKHMLKIFLWILGAFIFLHIIEGYLDIENWVKNNYLFIALIALLVGILPYSGPHIVFITLYMSHAIPFSVLLMNSIVQDGHGALPLLAESKKSFLSMKAVNILVAAISGYILYLTGI